MICVKNREKPITYAEVIPHQYLYIHAGELAFVFETPRPADLLEYIDLEDYQWAEEKLPVPVQEYACRKKTARDETLAAEGSASSGKQS